MSYHYISFPFFIQLHSPTGTTTTKFPADGGRRQKSFREAVLQEPTTPGQAISRQMQSNPTIFCGDLPFPVRSCTSAFLLHRSYNWVSVATFPVSGNESACPKPHLLKPHHCLTRQISNLRLVLHRKSCENFHQEPEDLPCCYKRSIRTENSR